MSSSSRRVAFATLLVCELAAFGLFVPLEAVARLAEAVRVLVGPFGRQFAVLFVLGTVFFGWTSLREEWRRDDYRPSPVWLVAHLTVFAFCCALAFRGMGIARLNSTEGWSWGLALLGCTIVFAAASVIIVAPIRSWFHRNPGAFAAGAIAGVAGCVTGIASGHWRLLSYWTLRVVERLLPIFGQRVFAEVPRLIIGTPDFHVYLASGCSGLEGIGIVAVFLVGYLWIYREDLRFPAAAALVPLAIPIVWLANAVRIAVMIALAGFVGNATTEVFHSMAGWLSLNAIALGLVLISRRMRLFTRVAHREETADGAGVYLLPLFFVVVTAFITRFGAGSFDRWYGLRVAVALVVLFAFREELSHFTWRPSWWAVTIGALTFAVWIGVDLLTGNAVFTRTAAAVPAAWIAVRIAGAVVTVPLVEELAFRGYVLRKLIGTNFEAVGFDEFTWPSFLGSSAIFGVLHGRWIAGIAAGMLFALAARRRGRFSDAVYAHATANALIAIVVVFTKSWSLWT